MNAIDLTTDSPTLEEVIQLASEANIILRTLDGRQFVLAAIDDFADEIAAVRQNEALMRLLDERSSEKVGIPLSQVREHLKRKKTRQGKAQRGKSD